MCRAPPACLFQYTFGLRWSFHCNNPIFLPRLPVIVHEKLLQLPAEFFAQIVNVLDLGPTVIALFNRNNAIVSFLVFLVALFTFDNAYDPAFQDTARERRFIH